MGGFQGRFPELISGSCCIKQFKLQMRELRFCARFRVAAARVEFSLTGLHLKTMISGNIPGDGYRSALWNVVPGNVVTSNNIVAMLSTNGNDLREQTQFLVLMATISWERFQEALQEATEEEQICWTFGG